MKKILIMVLCVILASLPVMAEESLGFTVEIIENLGAELGFEGATGEEEILSAGDGCFVLWRRDMLNMYVYTPDAGWNTVKTDNIDEDWAETQLRIRADGMISMGYDVDVEEYVEECRQLYGSAAAAAFQLDYAWGLSAHKGNDFILLKGRTAHVVISLNDFNAHIIDGMYISDIFVGADGRMLCCDTDKNLKYIDNDGNVISYLDFRSIINYSQIRRVFEYPEEYVVIYSDENSDCYAAWIDKQGNLIQNVYMTNGFVGKEIALYSEAAECVIFNKNMGNRSLTVVANKDGASRAIVCAFEITYDNFGLIITEPENVVYEDGTIKAVNGYDNLGKFTDAPVICLLDDGKSAFMIYPKYDSERYRNVYYPCVLDLTAFEMYIPDTENIDSYMYSYLAEMASGIEKVHKMWDGNDYVIRDGMVLKISE